MILELDRYESSSHHLGPEGIFSVVLWLHGCDRGCPGCIAANLNAGEARERYPADLLANILCYKQTPDCIVISGGEPFRQPEGLAELLAQIDEKLGKRVAVMLYTGFCYEELLDRAQNETAIAAVLAHTDVLVDGPYIAALDDDKPYRGSSNQRMLFLSDRYTQADFLAQRRSAVITHGVTEITLSGIPSEATTQQWNAILAAKDRKE